MAHRPAFVVPALIWAISLFLSAPAGAASKATIAALGDPAPGGGLFAGPGFIGAPGAAGDGWIAFRGQLSGTASGETIVVAHMSAPVSRGEVASLGQTTPGPRFYTGCAGIVKQFIGNPAVNANGEVAFLALIQPPSTNQPKTTTDQASSPPPAGVFVYRDGALVPIACTGQDTGLGTLDLTGTVDTSSDSDNATIVDRSPVINDNGDVAFLAALQSDSDTGSGGAIFVARRDGGMAAVIRTDDPFDGGKFVALGPPALNNSGTIAFHARVTTTNPDAGLDGIFVADASTVTVIVRDGISPMPANELLLTFQDPVSLNDRGDVAFAAGPFADANGNGVVGMLVYSAGVTTVIGYPDQPITGNRVASVLLGPDGGGALAPPSVGPDGSVAFFVRLNAGNREAMVQWDPASRKVTPLVYTGGNRSDLAPIGGVYGGTESGPALDASGGIAFRVRVLNGPSTEAVVYRPAEGAASATVLGDAGPAQNEGFFGGAAFSAPILNDSGDVVFRAYVARAPTSVGIFRFHAGRLQAVVLAGDPAPTGPDDAFFNIVGQPSMNQAGAIAFAAQAAGDRGGGRGVFVADAAGIHAVAVRNDPAPGAPGTQFSGFAGNPQINDAGEVAFRGSTELLPTPPDTTTVRTNGIFLSDATGVHLMAYETQAAPNGLPFLQLGDPRLSAVPNILFRAPLGSNVAQMAGLFLADRSTILQIAIALQPVGPDVILTGFSGTPAVDPAGDVAFLATRARGNASDPANLVSLGPAIFRANTRGLAMVIARDMPGPSGGTFRGFGAPTMNGSGHLMFRGSFQPRTGGNPGLFLVNELGLSTYLQRSELTPSGGRFNAFNAQTSLNRKDELAFTASVTGGNVRSGIFLASPTTLVPEAVRMNLSPGKGRDRIAMRLRLGLGRISNGVKPGADQVIVSFADGGGALWSVSVPGKTFRRRKGAYVAVPARRSALRKRLRVLRLRVARDGTVFVAAASAPADMTNGGVRRLKPPFTVTLQVGDDAGTATVGCTAAGRRIHCE